ncbi:hypothetical protein CYQ88_01640 [Hydrogenovibrio sp. SC-1]|uniref:vWA domain-containing protein n=1 Tax=Hydrogenovibrio sp. SC-1 TaxID=2065820 RepID=UPI000C7C3AD2|nr:VWA domain-containing protein [Hydrogenovibrio sp. SC-1]PLA75295.1 hypothetical protein CYQ88_01640 [Hydrogenovibrio sp. SC-1]
MVGEQCAAGDDVMDSVLAWQWRQPELLWLLLAPLFWGALVMLWRRRRTHQYAQSHLLPWVQISKLASQNALKITRPGRFWASLWQPRLFLALAWIGLVIALAGPRTLVPSPEQTSRSGVDILVAIDASRSMMAQDVAPSRFLHAKALIESLVNRLEQNDRVGLMIYAGKPHLVSPLSYDRDLFQYYLNLVRPGMLPTLGSQTEAAIQFGFTHLQQTAGQTQILLLFSDGGSLPDSIDGQSLTTVLSEPLIGKVRLIGVGKTTPAVIPSQEHPTGALHRNGKKIMTQLQQATLEQLANRWQGQYFKASDSLSFLETLLADVSAQAQPRTELSTQPVWKDHSKPFIALAFFALLWAFYPIVIWQRKNHSQLTLLLLVGVFSLGLGTSEPAFAQWVAETVVEKEQQAYQALQAHHYDEAEQGYQKLPHFNGTMGAGAAAYRKKDYESSVVYFQQAAVEALSEQQRAYALLNLGNSFYQAGLFAQAIESYQQALLYDPNYLKAKHNLALAEKARQRESGQQQNEETGEGQGRGESSRDNEGAFYGGQRPDPEAGEGASGDAPEGDKDGKEFVLPEAPEQMDFTLNTAESLRLNSTANAILDQQQRRHRIEQFEKQLSAIQDNQRQLLKHLFEREEGFQATQTQAHPLPGVEPW